MLSHDLAFRTAKNTSMGQGSVLPGPGLRDSSFAGDSFPSQCRDLEFTKILRIELPSDGSEMLNLLHRSTLEKPSHVQHANEKELSRRLGPGHVLRQPRKGRPGARQEGSRRRTLSSSHPDRPRLSRTKPWRSRRGFRILPPVFVFLSLPLLTSSPCFQRVVEDIPLTSVHPQAPVTAAVETWVSAL